MTWRPRRTARSGTLVSAPACWVASIPKRLASSGFRWERLGAAWRDRRSGRCGLGYRSGQNAIVRVDPISKEVKAWPLPASRSGANLDTAAFDGRGRIWFTGQTGIYGRLDPATGKMDVWDAPKGVGPYGITATPSGDIYYVSLAGSFLGKPDLETGETSVIEPKTKDAGTRRVWSDSKGRLWVSEWNVGNLSVYDPASKSWTVYKLPGDRAACLRRLCG